MYTTGKLRAELFKAILDLRSGAIDCKQCQEVTKAATQINKNMGHEIHKAETLLTNGGTIEHYREFGSMPI